MLGAAAQGRALRWSTVASQIGALYLPMPERDRIAFLVEVYTPLWDSKPVLSALLREEDGPLPCLPAVLGQLGVVGAAGVSAGFVDL
jgi:hypothetical protein